MSAKKKKSDGASMPASSAGLLSFYGEKTDSIAKVRPEIVVIISVVLMVSIVFAHVFLKGII